MSYAEKWCGSLRCLISTPQDHQLAVHGWPVILFLHGSEESAPMDLPVALTKHGPLNENAAPDATQKFVVIAPQLPEPGGDVWGRFADAVRQIILDTAADYQLDSSRLYLTGFSDGGNGVLDIAPGQADLWAALWPVDPPRTPIVDVERPIWVSAGQYSRQHKEEFRRVLGVQELQAGSAGRRVYQDSGLEHVDTAADAYANTQIYMWLLSHVRS